MKGRIEEVLRNLLGSEETNALNIATENILELIDDEGQDWNCIG